MPIGITRARADCDSFKSIWTTIKGYVKWSIF